jgi:hypothetical protein
MADPIATSFLGPAQLDCHPRSLPAYLAAEGVPLVSFFLMAPGTILIASLMLTAPLAMFLDGRLNPWAIRVLGVAWFLLCCSTFVWLFFLRFRGDYLVLHEDGFRYRINFFSRGMVRFADLHEIIVGGSLSSAQQAAYELAKLRGHPFQSNFEKAPGNRVTLGFKSGRARVLKGFGARFYPEDYAKFLTQIRDRHPRLVSTSE